MANTSRTQVVAIRVTVVAVGVLLLFYPVWISYSIRNRLGDIRASNTKILHVLQQAARTRNPTHHLDNQTVTDDEQTPETPGQPN